VQARLAVLKPVSAAISIGSGGPFGAEGPIIMTGGAFGSLIAQRFHLTAAERKTLLVAGSAAGMAATFGTPLAATLIAIELLLFEWKPRSLVPVALAAGAAMATRHYLFETASLFPVDTAVQPDNVKILLSCFVAGLCAGVLATAITASVYFFEDTFHRLRIHWMWWPAIGGVVIGLGGLIEPRALGVGYDMIGALLHGKLTIVAIITLVLVKWAIWSVSLGSGTSGGVLAPLLMLGAALGALLSHVLPHAGVGFWPLVCMGAILGGTMRAPLTGVMFAAEVSGDFNALLPLMIAVIVAHAFTVLVLRRSILTEKLARRGYHVTCEYEIDPLEVLFVREAMRPAVRAQPTDRVALAHETLRSATQRMAIERVTTLAVVDDTGTEIGTLELEDVLVARRRHLEEETRRERYAGFVPEWLPSPLGILRKARRMHW
jgi:chloride channel protein, CIC family